MFYYFRRRDESTESKALEVSVRNHDLSQLCNLAFFRGGLSCNFLAVLSVFSKAKENSLKVKYYSSNK